MSLLMNRKYLKYEVKLNSITPSVICNRQSIVSQVLVNLLSNATQFTTEEKSIFFEFNASTLPDPEGSDNKLIPAVTLSIIDHGLSISVKELNSVFDKFTQSSVTKTGAGDSSLGLLICKKIINQHNGRIWATGMECPTGYHGDHCR